MGLTYGSEDANVLLFHIESEWASIGIIFATAFVFSFLPGQKPIVGTWLLSAILIGRLAYILIASQPFSQRIRLNEQLVEQMRIKRVTKLCLMEESRLTSVNMLYWALPYESLMMSAIKGDKPQLTLFFVNPDNIQTLESLKNSKGFFNVYGIAPADWLNSYYFNIDTTRNYQLMTYEELFK